MEWLKKTLSFFDTNKDTKATAEDLELAKALSEEKYTVANQRINDQITDSVTTEETKGRGGQALKKKAEAKAKEHAEFRAKKTAEADIVREGEHPKRRNKKS